MPENATKYKFVAFLFGDFHRLQYFTLMKFILYTDGACSGNPGPGGYGAIVVTELRTVRELGGAHPLTTNNRMELQATITGLNFILTSLNEGEDRFTVQVYTDSVYVIRGITQWIFGWKKNGWKNSSGEPVVNKDLWQELERLVLDSRLIMKWSYVRGHNGDHGNERCDQIAVAYSKGYSVQLFSGPAQDYHFDVTLPAKGESLPESQFKKITGTKKESWYISLINGVVTKYKSWPECEAQVKGRPGAKFKKVASTEDEAALLKLWGK